MKKLFTLPQAFTLIVFLSLSLFSQCSEENIGSENLPNLRTLSAEEQELVQTSNDFAFDLFKAVGQAKEEENIFISPLSIDMALNMTANGASGDTKEVMKQTLGIESLSDYEANAAVRDLTDLLLHMDKKVMLAIANSMWYENTLTLKNGFSQIVEDYYNGKIEGLNFKDPAAKDIINGWVEDKTKGKIKDLIPGIDDTEVMFLVNAIYFKADWRYQFDKNQTKEDRFTLEDGSELQVPMMFSEGVKLNYYANELLQLLEIPYGNGQFAMVILLPHTDKTTADILSAINSQTLKRWIANADTLTPQLYMPKFNMKFKMDNMADILRQMGMGLAFSDQASFSAFFEEPLPLAISRVIHEGFIEVNEEGSEAAAATAVGIGVTSIGGGGNTPLVIHVDRPFVFFVREKHSGAVLFSGRLMHPA